MDWHDAHFKASWPDPSSLGKKFLPEIAFVGRSNVGKSTLINALCGQKGLAKISSTPGKTQHFVFFTLAQRLHLVDLPGYGYAKVSHQLRETWQTIQSYLQDRCNLILLLLDARHGWKEEDKQFLRWAEHNKKKIFVVFTKSDKLSQSELEKAKKKLAEPLANFCLFYQPKDLRSIEALRSKIEELFTPQLEKIL